MKAHGTRVHHAPDVSQRCQGAAPLLAFKVSAGGLIEVCGQTATLRLLFVLRRFLMFESHAALGSNPISKEIGYASQ